MKDFFEIGVYEKDGWIYIYPTSLTANNECVVNYPCTKIQTNEKFSNIGNAIFSASKRVENGLDQEANSNNGILDDLEEKNWKTFTQNVQACIVVKNRNGSPNELQIHEGVKKRGGYEYTNKKSVLVSSVDPSQVGKSILEALGKVTSNKKL